MTYKLYISISIVVAALLIGLSCKYIFKKSNAPAEKIAEQIIENKTGIDLDFNPSTTNLIDNKQDLLKKIADKVAKGENEEK